MGLIDAVGVGPVAVDTSIFIYYIEENPAYLPEVAPLFERADQGELELVTSALTLLELLIVPIRLGHDELGEQYEVLLSRSRGLRLVDVDRAHLRVAAFLRAEHRLRTPDAIQLATALSARCSSFVTNDHRLPSVGGVKIVHPVAAA